MDQFATAREHLASLCRSYVPGKHNEATTRLRYIDSIIHDCLGWRKEQVVAEERLEGKYLDYSVGSPAIEWILEAKREGADFSLPVGLSGSRTVALSTACDNSEAEAAILQVMGYCQSHGVPIGVVCNGHQLLAFYASRQDGVPPLQGRALCFSSLEEMERDFGLLWSYLSPAGITSRTLQRILLGKAFRPIPPGRLADTIFDYPGFRSRSTLETDLKILGGLFIQDLESEESVAEEFVRECYVSSGALSQYALVSKEILRARYDPIGKALDVHPEPVRTRGGTSPQLTGDLVAAALSRRPLILLGDVGVGKSMFIRHLLQVDAAGLLHSTVVLYLNFGRQPALPGDLTSYVHTQMQEQLLSNYNVDIDEARFVRAVYNGDLNRFRKGIYGALREEDPAEYRREETRLLARLSQDRGEHVKRALGHLKATAGRASLLVLDNIDQRPAEFQDQLFLIAQSIAETWASTVFLSLRPSTFYESRSSGSLAAYQLRVFTVSPTRTDEVIGRRLAYAKSQATVTEQGAFFPRNLSLSGDQLKSYLDVLIRAFTGNDDVKELVDNMSGGNLRLALQFLAAFVGSGYVSTSRVLDVAESGRTYVVPLHEFLRSMIYGDYDHYDPKKSEVCNLFDVSQDDGREHFLLPMLLTDMQAIGESLGGDGFVDAAELYRRAQTAGFTQEQVGAQIERASKKRLIETPIGGPATRVRITTAGAYTVQNMLRRFTYVDAMIVDTPITDLAIRQQIRTTFAILERVERAEVFTNYLDACWSSGSFDKDVTLFSWPSARAALLRDIEDVRNRAVRAAGRR